MYLAALLLSLVVLVAMIADRAWGALLAGSSSPPVSRSWPSCTGSTVTTSCSGRAQRLDRDEEPELHELVDRLAAAADVPPHSPRPHPLLGSERPSAGMRPDRAMIAVTTELLRRLDDRELGGARARALAHRAPRRIVDDRRKPTGHARLRDVELGQLTGPTVYLLLYWPVHLVGLVSCGRSRATASTPPTAARRRSRANRSC